MEYKVVIVDDEPDIHTVSQMVLKKLRFQGHPVQLFFLPDAKSFIEHMQEHPDTAVVLLDVVMEDEQAGLRAVKQVREVLLNDVVRILLRTGQPGRAPEQQVIETYDIDGYLAKAEMTNTRLFSAVRTALKNYHELLSLQQHRDMLWQVTQLMMNMTASESLTECLERFVHSAALLVPSELSVLYLETPEDPLDETAPPYHLFFSGPDEKSDAALAEESAAVVGLFAEQKGLEPGEAARWHEGYVLPFRSRRAPQQGFLYLQRAELSPLELQVLTLLASQTGFALELFAAV